MSTTRIQRPIHVGARSAWFADDFLGYGDVPSVDSEFGMADTSRSWAYTPEQVAKRLNMGRTAVFARIKSGELRSFAVGRSRRISDVALSEFISRLEEESEGSGDESRKR